MEAGSLANWASVVIALTAILFTALSNRARATKDTMDALDKRLTAADDDLDHRLAGVERSLGRLETDFAHLPDKDTVHDLRLAVADLRRDIAVIAESVKPVAAIAARMQDWMLEHGK